MAERVSQKEIEGEREREIARDSVRQTEGESAGFKWIFHIRVDRCL